MASFYSNMMRDKLVRLMLRSNSAIDLIETSKSHSEKGFVAEVVWDLLIKFGIVDDKFPRSKFQYKIGNMNNCMIRDMQSLQSYLQETKVISGNTGGASDITLYDKYNEKYIFITSKYPRDVEGKSVDYYGIDEIVSRASNHSELYSFYEIYLIVPNKQSMLAAVKRSNASSKGITKYMTKDHILDNSDLEYYFKKFKKEVSKIDFNNYDSIFGTTRESLKLRFHQRIVIYKTRKLVAAGETKILWGHKCRSGKTYMAGALIAALKYDKHKLSNKGFNAIVITPAPSETLPQFKQDLFERFNNFQDLLLFILLEKIHQQYYLVIIILLLFQNNYYKDMLVILN